MTTRATLTAEAMSAYLRGRLAPLGVAGGEVSMARNREGELEVYALRDRAGREVDFAGLPWLALSELAEITGAVEAFRLPEELAATSTTPPGDPRPKRSDYTEPDYIAALVRWEKRHGLAPGQRLA